MKLVASKPKHFIRVFASKRSYNVSINSPPRPFGKAHHKPGLDDGYLQKI
jgi:hypothetical protein